MLKNILISHNSIPTETIGSWKRMITDLNEYDGSIFDYIICPLENRSFLSHKHINVKGYRQSKLLNKFVKFYRYRDYILALDKLLKREQHFIITIIDNYGILLAVEHYLLKNNKRKSIKIIFLQHGHNYYLNPQKKQEFFNAIDLLVVLTKASYKIQLLNVHAIPCRVKQLYNGVDSSLFKGVSKEKQKQLRESLGFKPNKKYFLWLSQDRKKKGLHLILKVWEEINKTHKDIELLIIGTKQRFNIPNVTTLGIIPNKELPMYYSLSDFYLFPSLCYEGHSLSLTEALKSGCYCIASDLGANSEVLGYGDYGQLVENPNFEKSWVDAINYALKLYISNALENPYSSKTPKNIYDLAEWRKKITEIINLEKWSVH
ncbi:glycosyltransferase family 4 protein [Winogradskyella sp. F6397]|uniref:Glycosyltransferase family 4 protein n=1 Tax=Winogradskyella marina TaxID=2785530 RepID=A0ABS0EKJ6_9FLAO|nr:glycosyltransferase family 4 protein [Winogradskyella marina]MBF8150982.1 glycosyltransferase family 4 protein [Winogradskyella marina]